MIWYINICIYIYIYIRQSIRWTGFACFWWLGHQSLKRSQSFCMKHHEAWNTMKPKSVEATHMKAVSAPVRTLRKEGRVLALEISNATWRRTKFLNKWHKPTWCRNDQTERMNYHRGNPEKKSPYIWIVWFPKWVPWLMTPATWVCHQNLVNFPPKKKKLPKLSGRFQWVLGVAHNVSREKKKAGYGFHEILTV